MMHDIVSDEVCGETRLSGSHISSLLSDQVGD